MTDTATKTQAATSASLTASEFVKRIESRAARVGIIGLGYVGLPLSLAFRHAGFSVTGFDIDPEKISLLEAHKSYMRHVSDATVAELMTSGGFLATADFTKLADVDAIIVCVPTPLTRNREPDLQFIVTTGEIIAKHLRKGQLVVLESTSYPGTTTEVLGPTLEQSGLRAGRDFYLAFSPEREDPGNADYGTTTIPKITGADDADALLVTSSLYAAAIKTVVPVSSAATAEAVKLTENIFRSVNIALVNELKLIYDRMGIDIWEVIDAAKTKPFGFMAFYPGPGLGGHCIPIDPFYLSWKAREFNISAKFIELAGEINTRMPEHVVHRLGQELNDRAGRSLNGSRILVIGAAYKKNISDMRESPSLHIIELLQERGADVSYYDPYVPVIPPTREHARLANMQSIEWNPEELGKYDAALIATDHDSVDYEMLVTKIPLVVDTRNATKKLTAGREKIVKA